MRPKHHLFGVLLMLAAVPVVACSVEESSAGTNDDLTSIKKTVAKQQSVANCWLYATASWAESLHLRVSKESLDLSEAYWSYFHWFDQLTDAQIVQAKTGWLYPTGWWGTGVELARQRGWMNEKDFLPQDLGVTFSVRQQQALEALQLSLQSGVLSRAGGDRATVIAELNRA